MLMMNNNDKQNNVSADQQSGNEGESNAETIIIINCVLNTSLMLISILGNALVLAAIIRTPCIRSTSTIMLCSLAVSDLLVGLIAQPIHAAFLLTNSRSLFYARRMLGRSLCIVSFLTITAITVDRFLALYYHMRYATLVTKPRVRNTLVIIWVISFLVCGIFFWNKRVHYIFVSLGIIICLIISTFSYTRIYLIVLRHQLQIDAQQQAVQSSNAANNLNVVRLKRSAMNTFVFYFALILCYFPFYILLTIHGLANKKWKIEWEFAMTLVFSNSSINPFLYCWRLRELRTAVVSTARQILCKQREENYELSSY